MSGQVFPASAPRACPESERVVYDALQRHLPDGWRAWHSLRLRATHTTGGARSQWEGEGDFVLAHAHHGVLVLEVKGGQIRLEGGHWLQNGRRMQTGPREQAQRFVRQLMDAACPRAPRPPFGVACVFPDVDFSEPPETGDLVGLVWGPRELHHLKEALPALVQRALPTPLPGVDRRFLDRLHALWGETWVPTVSLQARVQDAEAARVRLDDEQLAALDMFGDNPRAWVEGPAGSGKTVVARELCLRRARQGARVLYLCFTDALARAVDASFAAARTDGLNVRAVPLRREAQALLAAQGIDSKEQEPSYWETVGLAAAIDALPPERERPDFVVVDEAQDLQEGDWDFVDALVGERALWVFCDPQQGFWRERAGMPARHAALPRVTLRRQQRCPEALFAFARTYGPDDIDATPAVASSAGGPPPAPDATILACVPCAADGRPAMLGRIVDRLVADGARPGDIAVLTLAGQTRTALFGLERVGRQRVVRADAADAAEHVVLDTFLRFKGLERPFVILVELDLGQHRYGVRMHVALTRASMAGLVVATPEQVATDARLARLAQPAWLGGSGGTSGTGAGADGSP